MGCKAATKPNKNRKVLLSFYDVPVEHWTHVPTSHPIKSTFATGPDRTGKTKACLSRKTRLAMAVRLVMSAQAK